MKIATINYSPEAKKSVISQLTAEFNGVIDRFCDEHPELPAALMLGVLRMVEHNLIARFEDD